MIKPNNTPTASASNPLTEIYRDQWLLAVHKPAGLLLHRSPIDRHETEFALQYARALNAGEHIYPVHRLDRPTSGLLLFARDAHTASLIGKALMVETSFSIFLKSSLASISCSSANLTPAIPSLVLK